MCWAYLRSSIGKKQIVAATGLVLISFVVAHLAGNLSFYLGAAAFNAYAAKLKSFRPVLNVAEAGLLLIFIVHMITTFCLILQNRRARGRGYACNKGSGVQTLSSKLMSYTGPIVLIYVILHLFDYTWADHHGAASVVRGVNYGLYGLVYRSFTSWGHSLWYIVAMIAVGFHLDHGVQSFFQTFGLNNKNYAPCLKKLSRLFAIVITLGYVSIPLYVFVINNYGCTR
jgi:succinate dehydrogenase / fumarate reductase cytochrome b subunit